MTIKAAQARVLHADCLDAMRNMEADSIDAIVTDPPYGLAFMGKGWDHGVPGVEFWREALRVAKPGAHLVAFGGTRTYHRLACAIEDAGWEVRDCLSWLYGSGFPKSLDVSKAIDKMGGESVAWFIDYVETVCAQRGIAKSEITALFPSRNGNMTGWFWNKKSGNQNLTPEQFNRIRDFLALPFADLAEAEREIIGHKQAGLGSGKTYAFQEANGHASTIVPITAPATDAARAWQGWGTALKPAWEPIILARKPLVGTVAANVLAHGTGAINVDGCRIGWRNEADAAAAAAAATGYETARARKTIVQSNAIGKESRDGTEHYDPHAISGRWPANVALDEEAAAILDGQTGDRPSTLTGRAEAGQRHDLPRDNKSATGYHGGIPAGRVYADSGGASRFFYTAKASRKERGEGNVHPTVKPLALMRWLVQLVTPKGGVVLDPFAGSGTTLLAAQSEGFDAVGIEREAEYVEIIKKRIS